jgi:UDP-3-O-[3-hydroxymyristoyl] glucosamine N-acyltransferase
MKIQQIAQMVGGQIVGNDTLDITGLGTLDNAKTGDIIFLDKNKYEDAAKNSSASAILTTHKIETEKTQIITANPKLAFAKILAALCPESSPTSGINPQASIGKNVQIDESVSIGPFSVIGDGTKIGKNTVIHSGVAIGPDCKIGDSCIIFPNATLYRKTELRNEVIIHAGAVIGADGFGYILDEQGKHFKINQVGNVIIEERVEVGANACIDRASIGSTLIKEGTKIDNLVQIAHNCTIGEHSIIVSQAGIAGSCTLGKYNVLAGQSGVADHVNLGDKVTLAAQSGAFRSIKSGEVYAGVPAVPAGKWRRYVTHLPKLSDYARKIKELEKRLADIENKNNKD